MGLTDSIDVTVTISHHMKKNIERSRKIISYIIYVRLVNFGPKFLLIVIFIFILIYFLFFILESRVKIRVMLQSYCYISVTSDDMVTVIVI